MSIKIGLDIDVMIIMILFSMLIQTLFFPKKECREVKKR